MLLAPALPHEGGQGRTCAAQGLAPALFSLPAKEAPLALPVCPQALSMSVSEWNGARWVCCKQSAEGSARRLLIAELGGDLSSAT